MSALGPDSRCPIARTLDALGDRWTLLVVREAMFGSTRFSEFLDALGAPRDVLTARLNSLVDGGVLERRPYKPEGGRTRDEYVITEAGRALAPVLAALGEWGLRYRPNGKGPLVDFVDAETGESARIAFVSGGRQLTTDQVATRVA
ncbi:winged helix-turn-helix transcriptional regulator [Naasia lichenicola]|uniref:Helix-turn-helix transcriptional regulator n=1 Tax=Naasia lichenicola TaxID=2565933 RepID=A0A4S4FJG4_9MICO|nr:helix-turn-helix domain-containing protein [Naasia lichenicola]THG29276.1 helix-turn-helix transcriptional regulator [Naasia lichenicola]